MNDFINKISPYDQLGFLVVGGLFYLLLSVDLQFFGIDLNTVTENPFLIGIIIYFLGHVAQALANFFITERKREYSPENKIILDLAKQKFGMSTNSYEDVFGVCYLWAVGEDKTGHIAEMNAKYGLYRGWSIVLFLQCAFYFGLEICELSKSQFNFEFTIYLIISLLIALLMLKRSKRFYKNISSKTIQTFIIHSNK